MRGADRWVDVGRLVGFSALFSVLAALLLANGPESILAQGGAALLAALLASGVFLRLEGQPLAALGLALGGSGRELMLGVLLGLSFAAPALLLAPTLGGLRWGSEGGTLIQYVGTGLWTLAILVIPAAAEELLFRGYLMRVLLRGWGPAWALLVTSAAFAALHGANPGVGPLAMGNILLAGALLGLVYLKTGSLWWAIGVHTGWNFATAFVADLPLSGVRIVDSPLVEVAYEGRELVTGGSFGLEGGLAATAALVLAGALVWLRPWLNASGAALAAGSVAPLSSGPGPLWPPEPFFGSVEGPKSSLDADHR